jgi:hypothetical protein
MSASKSNKKSAFRNVHPLNSDDEGEDSEKEEGIRSLAAMKAAAASPTPLASTSASSLKLNENPFQADYASTGLPFHAASVHHSSKHWWLLSSPAVSLSMASSSTKSIPSHAKVTTSQRTHRALFGSNKNVGKDTKTNPPAPSAAGTNAAATTNLSRPLLTNFDDGISRLNRSVNSNNAKKNQQRLQTMMMSPSSAFRIQRLTDQMDSQTFNSPQRPALAARPLSPASSMEVRGHVGGLVGFQGKYRDGEDDYELGGSSDTEEENENDLDVGLHGKRPPVRWTSPVDGILLTTTKYDSKKKLRLNSSVLKRVFRHLLEDTSSGGARQIYFMLFVCKQWWQVGESILWESPRFLSLNAMMKMNRVINGNGKAPNQNFKEEKSSVSGGLLGMLGMDVSSPKPVARDPRKFLFGDPCNKMDEDGCGTVIAPINPLLSRYVKSISYNFFNPADRKHPLTFSIMDFVTDNFKNLTSISLSGSPDWIEDFLLKRMAASKHLRSSLRSLELVGTHKLSREALGSAGLARLSGLKRLVVENVSGLDNLALDAIRVGCEGLDTLILRRCESVTDVGIGKVLSFATCLTVLEVVSCSKVKGEALGQHLIDRQMAVASGVRPRSSSTLGTPRGSKFAQPAKEFKSIEQLSLGDFTYSFSEQMLVDCLAHSENSPLLTTLHLRNIDGLSISALQKIMARQRDSIQFISIKTCPELPLVHQLWKELIEGMGSQLRFFELWLQPRGQHAMSYVDVEGLTGLLKGRGCVANIVTL